MKKNIFYAQSGGVTPVINATAAGLIDYVTRNKGSLNNNPSPGNKAGGLTTILEKSLGAAAKGGTKPLNDVLIYAHKAE